MSHSLAWGSSCFLPLEQMFVHILGLYLVGFKDSRWYFCEVSSSPRPDCFPPSVLWRNLLPFPGRLIWVCFVAAEGEEEAELGRGTAVPWRIPPGWVPPSCCPAAAGEGFRLWNCIPLLKKNGLKLLQISALLFSPDIRMGKLLFLPSGLEAAQVVPESPPQPVAHSLVSLPSLSHTAWCHCQAWPHVPVTPKDAEQHQPHHQPQLTQLWFSFCFIFSLTHQIWREGKQMTDDFGTCCCWLLKEKHFEMSTTALFAFIYGCFPIACLICVCKYSSGTQHNFHSKCLTLFLTPLHSW